MNYKTRYALCERFPAILILLVGIILTTVCIYLAILSALPFAIFVLVLGALHSPSRRPVDFHYRLIELEENLGLTAPKKEIDC